VVDDLSHEGVRLLLREEGVNFHYFSPHRSTKIDSQFGRQAAKDRSTVTLGRPSICGRHTWPAT